MPRLVVPGLPHHVTQRGSRRQLTFLQTDDFRRYLNVMAEGRDRAGVEVWAYCLMPNHVHMLVVPSRVDSLATWFGEGHRRYTSAINSREGWRGHLWQERFYSCVLDDHHLWAAGRYVELNPVRAGLRSQPDQWPWSSARAHLEGRDDALVRVAPLLDQFGDWATYLDTRPRPDELERLRQNSRTGRPLGDDGFVGRIERLTGRLLVPKPPGRPPKPAAKSGDSLPISAPDPAAVTGRKSVNCPRI